MTTGTESPQPWPFHEIHGVRLAYRSIGAGPPVLLAHGVPGDLRTWLPVAMRLAGECEAITVSLPALLAEQRPGRPFGVEGQRDDLIDIIAKLERGPVHLVAWSYAAHAALALAVSRADLVRSLFLYEPGFPTFVADLAAREAVAADTMAAFGPVAEALAQGDEDLALARAIDGAAGAPGHFDAQPEDIRTIHRDNAAMVAAIFKQTPPLMLAAADLAAIRRPVTVARGALTRTCYRIVSDEAARLIPGARHVVVPGAGHLLPEQRPDAFVDLIRAHLGDAARGGETAPATGVA